MGKHITISLLHGMEGGKSGKEGKGRVRQGKSRVRQEGAGRGNVSKGSIGKGRRGQRGLVKGSACKEMKDGAGQKGTIKYGRLVECSLA